VEIIDEFLKKEEHSAIFTTLTDVKFNWHYNNSVVYKDKPSRSLNDFQFTHIFYRDNSQTSPYYSVLAPLLRNLKSDVLVRAKANFRPSTPTIEVSDMHTDIAYPTMLRKPEVMSAMKTAIYYLNTNDGYTLFEDGTKVESVANRVVVFPATMSHAGTTHTNTKYRIVINFNYF
jgi:hypothetical protein